MIRWLRRLLVLTVFYALSFTVIADGADKAREDERPMPGSTPEENEEQYPATWYHGAFNKKGKPFPDKIGILIGSFHVRGINLEAQLTPKGVPLGAILNFKNDLGVATSDDSYRIDGFWRFNPRHRLDVTYYKIQIEGDRTLQQDFTWDGEEYLAGARIQSFFEQETFKINYLYSFFHTKKVELGIGAGLHLTDLGVGLKVINVGDVPGLAPDINDEGTLSATVPLPVFSLLLEYHITPRFSVRSRNDVFAIEYEGIRGQFTDQILSFEYQFIRNFALGLGWNRVNLDVKGDTSDATWSLNSDYDGWNVYAKGIF